MERKRKTKRFRQQVLSLGIMSSLILAPLSTGTVAFASDRFMDVPSDFWAAPAIDALAAQQILSGETVSLFNPNGNVTRAEFAKLLVSAMHLQASSSQQVFTDVPPSSWAYTYVQTAYAAGVIHGVSSAQFQPDGSISRQDMAKMIAGALHVQYVPQTAGSSFADQSQISGYASQSVAAAVYLGLLSGYPDHTFKPAGLATRAEAAKVIYQMMNADPNRVRALSQVPITQISVTPGFFTLTTLDTQQLSVQATDANGQAVASLPVTWSVYGGIGSVSQVGLFTPGQTGTGYVTASYTNPTGIVVSNSVYVNVQPPVYLSFSSNNLGDFTPTQQIQAQVNVDNASGALIRSDSGRTISIKIDGPDGSQTLQAQTVNGVANFSFSKTVAGTYHISLSATGSVAPSPATFTVVPGPAAAMSVHVGPSTFLRPTERAVVQASFYDNWGNQISGEGANFSVSNSVYGSLQPSDDPSADSFVASNVKGTFTVTATAGFMSASEQVNIYNSASDLVSGKGDWMLWSDWKNYPVSDTIARLKAAGVTHVYLEVSTTSDGFYGQDALDDFLPKAHAAGIVVMGWVYASLSNPWQDASQTEQVIQYKTPSGDQIDGLGADLEENLSSSNITAFASSIRNTIGSYYPMVAVVYPSSWPKFANQPWDIYQKYFNVVAPMLYWHYMDQAYTYHDVYNAVMNELTTMHKDTNNMPVEIIGQSYNMFTDPQNPSADEIKGAMQAAKDYGAIGYSTYRGRTATNDEWSAFSGFNW